MTRDEYIPRSPSHRQDYRQTCPRSASPERYTPRNGSSRYSRDAGRVDGRRDYREERRESDSSYAEYHVRRHRHHVRARRETAVDSYRPAATYDFGTDGASSPVRERSDALRHSSYRDSYETGSYGFGTAGASSPVRDTSGDARTSSYHRVQDAYYYSSEVVDSPIAAQPVHQAITHVEADSEIKSESYSPPPPPPAARSADNRVDPSFQSYCGS